MLKRENRGRGLVLSVIAAMLLVGCSSKDVKPKDENLTQSITQVDQKTSVSLSVADMSVRKLIKSVCEANALSCDFSVQPSDKYAVTFNYSGDVTGLLLVIKRQTGINYKLIDGMITIDNKDDITQYQDPLKKDLSEKNITVSFKNMKLSEAFKYFYDEFGYSFSFDMHYTNISPTQGSTQQSVSSPQSPTMPVLATMDAKNAAPAKAGKGDNVTFYYNGSDPKEALESFLLSVDMTMTEVRDKEFKVRDFDVAMLDKSVYFDYEMTSGEGGSSGSGATPGAASGASSSGAAAPSSGGSQSTSTTKVSLTEHHRQDLERVLRNYLSDKGKLDMSMRGYIVVEDKPSMIKQIRKIVKKEIEKEAPLSISINIVRIDLKDDYKAGVDWNAVWNKGFFGAGDLSISSSMSQLVNGGFSFKGNYKGTEQILTMLQEYGNTKIERSRTINARSGFLANFEATKPIPYVTTTSTITGGTTGFAQGSITPLFEEEGVIINMLPNIDIDTKTVDLGIDVSVAEYIGDKSFDLGDQGVYTLPVVTKDKGKFAVQAKLGETIVLTGFKVKKGNSGKKGIPFLSQIPIAGSLFGYQETADDTSEILIILKVDQAKIQG